MEPPGKGLVTVICKKKIFYILLFYFILFFMIWQCKANEARVSNSLNPNTEFKGCTSCRGSGACDCAAECVSSLFSPSSLSLWFLMQSYLMCIALSDSATCKETVFTYAVIHRHAGPMMELLPSEETALFQSPRPAVAIETELV